MKSNKKLRQHYLLHCCVVGVIENIKASEKKSQDVLKRLIKRSESIRNFTLAHKPDNKEWLKIDARIKKLQKLFENNLSYDALVFQKALMIAVAEIQKTVPKTVKYSQLWKDYYYLSEGMFTFFKHLDNAKEDSGENWIQFRREKANLISKKMLRLIREDL